VVDLAAELRHLVTTDPALTDTTLLIHPFVFQEFAEYNAFLDRAETTLTELELDGVIQMASFHPASWGLARRFRIVQEVELDLSPC
jgi:uncharacterized protein